MFIFVGLALTVAGCIGFINARRAFRAGRRTNAEVVDVQWWSASGDADAERGAYYPIVSFRADDGRMVRARTRTGRVPAPAKVGEHVRVIYNPADPRIVAIDSLGGRGAALFGLIALIGAAVLVVQIYRMAR